MGGSPKTLAQPSVKVQAAVVLDCSWSIGGSVAGRSGDGRRGLGGEGQGAWRGVDLDRSSGPILKRQRLSSGSGLGDGFPAILYA